MASQGKKGKQKLTTDQPTRFDRFFAPAKIESFATSLILCMTIAGREEFLLKTLSFLSFQISQVMSMIAVFRPLGEGEGDLAKACQ
jgi:hypothetical protein